MSKKKQPLFHGIQPPPAPDSPAGQELLERAKILLFGDQPELISLIERCNTPDPVGFILDVSDQDGVAFADVVLESAFIGVPQEQRDAAMKVVLADARETPTNTLRVPTIRTVMPAEISRLIAFVLGEKHVVDHDRIWNQSVAMKHRMIVVVTRMAWAAFQIRSERPNVQLN
ncbi:MAG: hypothetical protein ACRC1K_15740 [Planctomycetia bacterium]